MNTKDKITYLMIGLNGVILTAAIFFVMNFFVNETIAEEKLQIVNQSQKIIISAFAEVDSKLLSIIPHISNAQGLAKEKESIQNSLSSDQKNIVITSLHFVNGTVDTIYQYPTAQIKISDKSIIEFIDLNKATINSKGRLMSLFDGKNYIFIRTVPSLDKSSSLGYLVAFISTSESQMFAKLVDIPRVEQLVLSDGTSQEVIYGFNNPARKGKYGNIGIKSLKYPLLKIFINTYPKCYALAFIMLGGVCNDCRHRLC